MGQKTKLAMIIAAVLAALSAALALTARKSVMTEIEIAAAPDAVWQILTDPDSYEKWHGVLTPLSGAYGPHEIITYRVRSPNGGGGETDAEIIGFEEGRLLNQYGGMPLVLTYDHFWVLEPTERGTKLVQKEIYRGIGTLFWDNGWVAPAYRAANRRLKFLAETKAAAQGN